MSEENKNLEYDHSKFHNKPWNDPPVNGGQMSGFFWNQQKPVDKDTLLLLVITENVIKGYASKQWNLHVSTLDIVETVKRIYTGLKSL